MHVGSAEEVNILSASSIHKKNFVVLHCIRRRKMQCPATLLVIAAISTLLPTFSATNLLRKLSLNDRGPYALINQTVVGDSPGIGEMGATSQNSALSVRLDTSIQGSQQTYSQDRLLQSATPLNGYLIVATYSDNTCTTEIVADATLLNFCMKDTTNGGTEYMTLTATESYSFKTFYFDKECTQVISVRKPKTYLIGCTESSLTYVSESSIPPSTVLMASERYTVRCVTQPVLSFPSLTILQLCSLALYITETV